MEPAMVRCGRGDSLTGTNMPPENAKQKWVTGRRHKYGGKSALILACSTYVGRQPKTVLAPTRQALMIELGWRKKHLD
jgi:hypothetical protein